MNSLEQAIIIATNAHAGQVDKAGQPYILHPLRLMLKFQTDSEMIVAVMHDVIEDSEITQNDLKKSGFSDEIIEAIVCLSKKQSENYESFIRRVSKNELARKIKIEDIKDNLNLSRLNEITDKDLQRAQKYHRALKMLT